MYTYDSTVRLYCTLAALTLLTLCFRVQESVCHDAEPTCTEQSVRRCTAQRRATQPNVQQHLHGFYAAGGCRSVLDAHATRALYRRWWCCHDGSTNGRTTANVRTTAASNDDRRSTVPNGAPTAAATTGHQSLLITCSCSQLVHLACVRT